MLKTQPAILDSLNKLLASATRGESLYLVVDAAHGIDVPAVANQCKEPCQSLFSGRSGDLLADVAPYLLMAKPGSQLVRWFADRWGESAGVFVRTRADFAALREHLRQLLAAAPAGAAKKYVFRFYDPRVLRAFLPACAPADARGVFGPVSAWICEDADPKQLLTLVPAATGVYVKKDRLDHAPAPERGRG